MVERADDEIVGKNMKACERKHRAAPFRLGSGRIARRLGDVGSMMASTTPAPPRRVSQSAFGLVQECVDTLSGLWRQLGCGTTDCIGTARIDDHDETHHAETGMGRTFDAVDARPIERDSALDRTSTS